MEIYRSKAEIEAMKYRRVCGIYCFIHNETGHRYVGQSVNIWRRFVDHMSHAKTAPKTYFSRAIRKYGMEAFSFEVLEVCEQHMLVDRERFWI